MTRLSFAELSECLSRLEATSKRLEMFGILSELFKKADADEIDRIIYITQGVLAAPFHAIEIGMSGKLLIRAISDAANLPTARIEAASQSTGDLGLVAESVLAHGGDVLSVHAVYDELMAIAETSGKGSVERKVNMLRSLLVALAPLEARYVSRFVIGALRLGVGDSTVLDALALGEGDRGLKPVLERAYNLCSDLGLVGRTLKREGIEGVRAFAVRVGYPIRPALCERLPSSEEIIARMGRAAVEAKYDGFRLQIHKSHDRIDIFSRNQERMTDMFPEITAAARRIRAAEAIFEGEALVHDETTGELLPFQVTIQRKRKHGVAEASHELPLKFFAFDLMFKDGEDLTALPYEERRARMLELIADTGGLIAPSEMFYAEQPADIDRFFEHTVESGLEGVVVKRPDAPYAAGSRNFNWIKLKRSYKGELADSVDLCIVGYFAGRGQRARFGIGALLGAVYDPQSDTFKTVSKIGSGFADEEFIALKAMLDEVRITHRHARVESDITPDVWVTPKYVVKVTADEITRSPSHTAGRDESGAGYALRFPRAVEFVRVDKSPEDATTVAEIVTLADKQKKVKIS